MEQRRLRLGDILDDYCPRERRVTNHAIVAMVEDDVKQTRCTTCDSEHAYKGGREPRRRKKAATAALYREVLADMPEAPSPAVAAAAAVEEPPAFEAVDESIEEPLIAEPDDDVIAESEMAPEPEPVPVAVAADPSEEGPINRPLIRATLPRPEGQKDVRTFPEFTIRHNNGRGGNFRGRPHRPGGNGNGNRPQGRRFSGQGAPHGGRGGFRGGQQHGQHHPGGKKRSR